MKIVRFKNIRAENRTDGRTVRKLASVELNRKVDSGAIYFCEVPSSKFEKHYHSESTEIIMFPKGGNIEINGKSYVMENWDFVILEPGDWHGFSSEGNNAVHLAFKLPDVEDKCTK